MKRAWAPLPAANDCVVTDCAAAANAVEAVKAPVGFAPTEVDGLGAGGAINEDSCNPPLMVPVCSATEVVPR